jgi:DNA-binding MarR family transcriptional regulator
MNNREELLPGSRIPAAGMETSTLRALRELMKVAGQVPGAVARRAGLSETELGALEHLAGGALGPADLARRLGITTAASSGVVDRLVGRGHAERHPHVTDGRRTDVEITASGRAEVLSHLMPMFEGLFVLDSSLEPEEAAVVERYLTEATAALRRLL